ncbi:DNA cytosine methyltransferase [Leuconostoc falkenbergense]|uniref:DNA cytosine methyltransferase n=1 Tax=Leuconostoc falkenbergense TaxID=2766470 RepID=UPI0024466702|nr:DNA cytosine methyltransferase [Leuconostoc falkenbergense]MDG9744030.1 DNA cytosine methyltransferase [Leuconostoc falkenbergense]
MLLFLIFTLKGWNIVNIKHKYNTASLFSGAGGLDIGLSNAGLNIVWANDILPAAVENYRHNIGEIIQKDITTVEADEVPDAEIIVGGFPCQPFSNAGKRLGPEDDRGNLYLEIIRLVKEKNPKSVVFENVRGILSMKNKDGSLFIDTVIYLLSNAGYGYDVKYKLLKASDYKVPQNRYRVIIVAFRKDLNINYQFPDPITTTDDDLTLGSILNIPDNVPNKKDVWKLSPQSQELIQYIPEGGSWKNVPYEHLPDRLKRIRDDMKKYHSPNFYRRFGRNEIAGTITAAATPENSGILHPIENRRFSVREIARIQSFPDDYEFVGSISNMYKVIGNAVPPLLGEVIGKSIIDALEHAEK